MARLNDEVEALQQEYADLILLTGGNAFRARSYEKAARSVGGYSEDIAHLDEDGLREMPGVGDSTADKIGEYRATGRIAALEDRSRSTPPSMSRGCSRSSVGGNAGCAWCPGRYTASRLRCAAA